MTTKPSDMPRRGVGMVKIEAVKNDEQEFWEYYGQSADDVERIFDYFHRTKDQNTAATLTLATIMNMEEVIIDAD